MPTATATRSIDAPAQDLWQLVSDPHHLPRWWPRVERVEAVQDGAFTEVLRSEKGRIVRADFELVQQDEDVLRLVWAQQVQGTPFERILAASETEVRLEPQADRAAAPTTVSITLTQTLPGALRRGRAARSPLGRNAPKASYGLFARVGSPLVRRAANATVKGALDGLERIAG